MIPTPDQIDHWWLTDKPAMQPTGIRRRQR